jgi:predicted tellurium resistance membrane protein TerC
MLGGGLFLIYKATTELYERVEGESEEEEKENGERKPSGSVATVLQILALDVVFSLDSVITAVGMARAIIVMMAAMIIAVGVMFTFAGVVSEFVNRHPTMKILALSFLLLIGVLLTADGFGKHVNRGYVYFAMAFSLAIELINMRVRKKKNRKRLIPRL